MITAGDFWIFYHALENKISSTEYTLLQMKKRAENVYEKAQELNNAEMIDYIDYLLTDPYQLSFSDVEMSYYKTMQAKLNKRKDENDE